MAKLHMFWHLAAMPGVEAIVGDRLAAMKAAGLLEEISSLHLCVVGGVTGDEVGRAISAVTSEYPETRLLVLGDLNRWEFPSIEVIRNFSKNHISDYSLYIHTKGITHVGKNTEVNTKKWRQLLEAFVISRFRRCVDELDAGWDTVGVNFRAYPRPHYSGNFWWAKNQWLAALPELKFSGDRYQPEFWICSKPGGMHKCLFDSKVNHYIVCFGSENVGDDSRAGGKKKYFIGVICYREGAEVQRIIDNTRTIDFHDLKIDRYFVINDNSHKETVDVVMAARSQGIKVLDPGCNYSWPLSVNMFFDIMLSQNYDGCVIVNADFGFREGWLEDAVRKHASVYSPLVLMPCFACFMATPEIVNSVGFMDPIFWPGYCEDADFWHRCCLYYGDDKFCRHYDMKNSGRYHLGYGAIRSGDRYPWEHVRSRLKFIKKWGRLFEMGSHGTGWVDTKPYGLWGHPYNNPSLYCMDINMSTLRDPGCPTRKIVEAI